VRLEKRQSAPFPAVWLTVEEVDGRAELGRSQRAVDDLVNQVTI
jgi:hypothetical protein